jgi:hypothetical protein
LDRRLESFGHVRRVDSDTRTVEVVVSTNAVARDGAIIDPRGWNFTNYDRNPVVLWAHDDASLPIARAIPSRRVVTDTDLLEVHEFADHPMADMVFRAVTGGFVNATSVRWIPGQTEVRVSESRSVLVFTTGHELLESSYVPLPADPGALVMRADGGALRSCGECGVVLLAGECDRHPSIEPIPTREVVTDSLPGRLAAFAAHIRESTSILKGA